MTVTRKTTDTIHVNVLKEDGPLHEWHVSYFQRHVNQSVPVETIRVFDATISLVVALIDADTLLSMLRAGITYHQTTMAKMAFMGEKHDLKASNITIDDIHCSMAMDRNKHFTFVMCSPSKPIALLLESIKDLQTLERAAENLCPSTHKPFMRAR